MSTPAAFGGKVFHGEQESGRRQRSRPSRPYRGPLRGALSLTMQALQALGSSHATLPAPAPSGLPHGFRGAGIGAADSSPADGNPPGGSPAHGAAPATVDTRRIGVVGLAGTGGAVARRLAGRGFEVTGYDPHTRLDDDLVAALTAAGVRLTRLPADAAEPAGIVLVDVSDDDAREEALFDAGGVGETLRDGGYVVDISSTAPALGADATRRLAKLGLVRVEAAFVGSPAAATSGELTVLLGCSQDEAVALRPLLRALTRDATRDVQHLGPVGTVAALRLLASTRASVQGAARALVDDEAVADAALRMLAAASPLGRAPATALALLDGAVRARVVELSPVM